jgi:hypothetical protein
MGADNVLVLVSMHVYTGNTLGLGAFNWVGKFIWSLPSFFGACSVQLRAQI